MLTDTILLVMPSFIRQASMNISFQVNLQFKFWGHVWGHTSQSGKRKNI